MHAPLHKLATGGAQLGMETILDLHGADGGWRALAIDISKIYQGIITVKNLTYHG